MNLLPFALVPLLALYYFLPVSRILILCFMGYVATLALLEVLYFGPHFKNRYTMAYPKEVPDDKLQNVRNAQYTYTEYNIQKYASATWVWPKSLHFPAAESSPLIFCVVPHGVAPLGITAYALWSKLFNSRLCHWTTAPVVLKIPIVSTLLRALGYIPAKAAAIQDTLMKKEESVGIVLDGVAGMFQQDDAVEKAFLKSRKGIVKIALKAGVPLVPVYGFGHTKLWKVVVDPFGILEALSVKMDTSLVPFYGRWGWPIGPPKRVPLLIAIGDPIACPQVENPTQVQIDEYHERLLKGYSDLFEKHKAAYGWSDKTLKFV